MTYVYDAAAPKILQQEISQSLRISTNNTFHTTSLFNATIKIEESNCNNFTGVIRANKFFEIQTTEETSLLDAVCRASTTDTCRGSPTTNGGNFAVIGALLANRR